MLEDQLDAGGRFVPDARETRSAEEDAATAD